MLSFFRINDPYRLVLIFIALIILKLPILIYPNWNTIPELSWMIVGERLNEGAILYVDIWDDIGPLSAWSFRIIDLLFGRSQLTLKIVGLVIFFLQIFFINYISLKHKMFNENNYLPALFYGLLGIIFFNVAILSPQLLGLTFVMLSMNHLFNHIESRNKNDGNLHNIGLYIGIASLFYLPYFFLILVHLVSLIFFTNTIQRRYLLLVYGVAIPFLIVWLVYVWQGNAPDFFGIFVHSIFNRNNNAFLSLSSILILGGTTAFLFGIASIKILSGFGFTVFQVRIQKVMFFASVVCLGIYILYSKHDGYSLILFFPWIAFFLPHFFLKIKNSLKRELGFLVYFLTVITLYLGVTFQLFNFHELVNLDNLIVEKFTDDVAYVNKKILVLGPNIKPYAISKQATPYFNWELSRDQLENLNYYDNLEEVNKNLRNDMPDFIIDQVELAPLLFSQIPLIGVEYEQTGACIYKRIKPNN